MNGNELANILKYSGGEWRAGELLPKEWWKKDFPYGEAESMGYRMSPEEIRSRKRKEKSISEQMADILRSKDFMMLNAADRMKVMETVRKIQEAEAKGKREREKHETEMLEIGRQTQMQAKVKAILESDRVPAQKVTALTMAGIPLTDARDMVWGKRAPGEEAGRAGRAAAPTARVKPTGEELATALRPEKRGVQFRMIGEELIKEPVQRMPTMEEITRQAAEETRLRAKFAPGEALRKEKEAIEDARKAKNAAIYADRRGATLEALQNRLKEAKAEIEARYARKDYVNGLGREMSDKNKAEEKARLDKEIAGYQGTRDAIKEKLKEEADKEERDAKDRQVRIDFIDAKGEARQTAEEKKEKERLEKLQEQGEKTREAVKEATEKDEEREKEELAARYEKAKDVDALGEAQATKRYQAKLDKAKYEEGQRKIARLETKEDRAFAQTILDKSMNWVTTFRNLGFDQEDFIDIVPKFLRILGVNRSQEQEIADALGLMFEKSEEAEKKTIKEFEGSLGEQASAIDRRVKIEGMTPELENQIEMMALLYLMLEEKKLSKGKGLDKWSSTLKTGGWYFGPAEIPFKTKAARDAFIKEIPKAIDRVRTGDLMKAASELLGEQAGKIVKELGKVPKVGKEIELPNGLITACTTFDDSVKNECYETYRTLFNTKGVMTEPAMGDRKRATDFVIGEDIIGIEDSDELRTKEELPINMNDSDYVKAVLGATTFNKKQKAWLFWKWFTPIHREGMRNQAGILGNLAVAGEEDTDKKGIGLWGWIKGMFEEKPETHWFFKPGEKVLGKMGQWWTGEKPEETKSTGNIRKDAEGFIIPHGMERDDPALRAFLKSLGWTDPQITAEGIGGE